MGNCSKKSVYEKITLIAICRALPIAVIAFIFAFGWKQTDRSSQIPTASLGETIQILGRDHVPKGTKISSYDSDPPTSGDHWPQPAEWGIYLSPLRIIFNYNNYLKLF